METLGTELNDAIEELSEIVATSEEGTEISNRQLQKRGQGST